MKYLSCVLIFCILILPLAGCGESSAQADIAATTLPVYQFTSMLVEGTGLTVTRLVAESVSCLHDYSLNVKQVKAIESATLIVMSGAGLEDFIAEPLMGKQAIDASKGIALLESCHDHDEDHDHTHHDHDAHIWLSPANAMIMANNICQGLKAEYPAYASTFEENLVLLTQKLVALDQYGKTQLSSLQCREIITFHDGFAYFAQAFDLTILEAVEEESGSEASAKELIRLIQLVESHELPAIFTEENGAVSAASILSAETGAGIYTLNMAMAGDDYFAAMYQNIDAIKEALG